MAGRGHIAIGMPSNSNSSSGGLKCCCCRCCTCINLDFLTTKHGVIKLLEAFLGGICQSLLVNYGLSQAGVMGQAFHGFLTSASACLLTTTILIICYLISSRTCQLVRQSIFETMFNGVACFSYLSASSCLGFVVNVFLYPIYLIQPGYSAYPAMTAVYYLGCIAGFVHGYDAYCSYHFFKGNK
ncbi:protein singles bar-like [Ctenocephalides felis]|uniref:protein singles bar-like n=1 Tax=Ctenocephalides felis TaxID=7515 RepID=UPI000E6E1109|nr:protein singles bar-like [Ctenocephalides felis]